MGRTYAEKRNAGATPEPPFEIPKPTEAALKFVVQRHEASHLHYDFRLECDGALKSWAVPKGPSMNPAVKRGAIMVEDHPIAYAEFEGRIPKGQYGGGEVIIWDEGTYAPEGADGVREHDEALVREGLERGELKFQLLGKRLKGSFVLVRMKKNGNWLLIKHRDDFATENDPTRETDSVRTHLTAEDLRAGRTAPLVREPVPVGLRREYGLMVPAERREPFSSERWTFEPKLDGVRALAIKDGETVRLLTRNGNDIAQRFPGVVVALRALPDAFLVLDGELVLLQSDGKPSFQALMEAYHGHGKAGAVRYYVFDLLAQNGHDYRGVALAERRAKLEKLPLAAVLQLLPSIPGEGEKLYSEALKMGFEGVVAKRLASLYRAGVSEDWLKIKGFHSEEFLIGGYTEGVGARKRTFGALLLGRRDEIGKLKYCGNVGTGFSEETLARLREQLDQRRIATSPFDGDIPSGTHPIAFTRPDLPAEVRFAEWTKDGRLRHPSFIRMRPDRQESDVPPAEARARVGGTEMDQMLLSTDKDDLKLELGGHSIPLSHLNKELWPGITKRDLLRYLVGIADVYLGYLRDRPLTFVRYPDGIHGEGFFQRHWDKGLPDFVETRDIFSKSNHGMRRHVLCNNLATLVWLGQISALELHPWHSRATGDGSLPTDFGDADALEASALNYPDYLVCDLDPNIRSGNEAKGAEPELNEAGWKRTVEVAQGLKEMLDALKFRGFVKTTGKTGLHIYVPVERRYDSDQVKEAARTLGEHLMKQMPGKITMELRLNKRPALVFFDANMNGYARTLASAYSPRPVPGARISMPISWDQLGEVRPEDFTIATAPAILSAHGDPWATMYEHRNRLPA